MRLSKAKGSWICILFVFYSTLYKNSLLDEWIPRYISREKLPLPFCFFFYAFLVLLSVSGFLKSSKNLNFKSEFERHSFSVICSFPRWYFRSTNCIFVFTLATILFVTHVGNISLCTSAISRYCVAGGLFGQRPKKLSWENAMRLVAFSRVFAALFPLSRNKPPLRRQGVSHFVLLFNKKIPQTTHVDYKVAQKNWNKKCCIILKHKRNVLFFLRIRLFDIGVSQIRRYRI